MGFVNSAELVLEFESGSVGIGNISWLTSVPLARVEVHGTGGTLLLDVRNNIVDELHGTGTPIDDLRQYGRRVWGVMNGLRSGAYFGGSLLFYGDFITDFLRSIDDENAAPPVRLEESILLNAVLSAAELSLKTGRRIDVGRLLQERGLVTREAEGILRAYCSASPTPTSGGLGHCGSTAG
jgi:predicted dehydrogenase